LKRNKKKVKTANEQINSLQNSLQNFHQKKRVNDDQDSYGSNRNQSDEESGYVSQDFSDVVHSRHEKKKEGKKYKPIDISYSESQDL